MEWVLLAAGMLCLMVAAVIVAYVWSKDHEHEVPQEGELVPLDSLMVGGEHRE